MRFDVTKTGDASKTVGLMIQTIENFSGDIGALKRLPLEQYFDFVKSMPYRRDPKGREIVSRPVYTLRFAPYVGRDCKKQTVMICSWARENGMPYRVCVVSNRPDKKPHHVFAALFVGGRWVDCDATYLKNRIGMIREYTYRKNYEAK